MKKILVLTFTLLLFAANAGAQDKAVSFAGPSWSPDGKWIAFTRMDITQTRPPKIDSDVYIVAADGTGARRVTGDGTNDFNPVFTKDGKSLIFGMTNTETRVANIVVASLDGSNIEPLTSNLNRASAPQLSRDGKWIAFNAVLTADANDRHPQIFIMKVDGTGLKQLTNDAKLSYYSPVWSPDGKRLVYYVERGDQKDQIWSMKADGTDQRLLTGNLAHNFYPSWTADGKRIIFTSNRSGKGELYSMAADGTDLKALGITTFFARMSPDGKRLVYIGGGFPNMQLYVANADGSNAVKIAP